MMLVVQMRHRLPQRLDARGRAILTAVGVDFDRRGPLKAAFDVVLDLGRALAKIGPLVLLLEEAELRSTLGAPDYTSRGTRGIKTCMRKVTLVRVTKLTVNLAGGFCRRCRG